MRTSVDRLADDVSSTKSAILAAAEEVFATYGYAGASTRAIVNRAQVNISSLHYHWSSKERLYFAVFDNVYARITEVIRAALSTCATRKLDRLATMTSVMAALIDFFLDHPTVPRLLARRLLENENEHSDIERRILKPAWQTFSEWVRSFGGKEMSELEANLFMLTVEGAVLLLTLDSPHVTTLLGGSASNPQLRAKVGAYLVQLAPMLLKQAAHRTGARSS